jgi:type IV pilus assembly protein PilC
VLVEVGEQSGRLDEALSTLAAYYDTQWNLVRTTWSHLLPMLLYFGLCGALIVFINYVQRDWSMTWLRQALTRIGIAAGIIVLVVLAIRLIAPLRTAILVLGSGFPFVSGIMRQSAISRFAMALRATLNAGLEVRRAIDLAAEATANPLLAWRLRRARKRIDNGATIAQALDRTGVFGSDAMSMIETGEQSGRLVDSLGHVAVAARFRATTAARTSLRAFTILIYAGMLLYVGYTVISLWGGYYQRILDIVNPNGD